MGIKRRLRGKKVERKEILIVGPGAEGTALAIVLAKYHDVSLWGRDKELASVLREKRENEVYLPGIEIPEEIKIFDDSVDPRELAAQSYCTVLAVPSYALGTTVEQFEDLEGGIFITISKGIEAGTLRLPLEICRGKLSKKTKCVFLSCVGFARKTAEGVPMTGILASKDVSPLNELAPILNVGNIRILKISDEIAVQLGSALKTVYSIAIGMVDGFTNEDKKIKNKLILLSLQEVTPLVEAMGGEGKILNGLSFLGDLTLSVNGLSGRNHYLGMGMIMLDSNEFREIRKKLFEELEGNKYRAEGLLTTAAALQLSQKVDVKLPIAEQVHKVIFNGKLPQKAARELVSFTQKK